MITKEEAKDAKNALKAFIKQTKELSPTEIAKYLRDLGAYDEEKFVKYIKKIPQDILGEVALELPEDLLKIMLEKLPIKYISNAFEELESDDATDLLQEIEEVDKDAAKEIFESLDEVDKNEITKLRSYGDDEAGAYMQVETFNAKLHESIQDAITRFRALKAQGELENIHKIFVTDENDVLLFDLNLEDFIIHEFNTTFAKIYDTLNKDYKLFKALDTQDIDEVIDLFQDRDIFILPVVDNSGKLLGRITADDIHDLIEDSATEQIYNLAGISNDDAEEDQSMYEAGKSRAIWLFINLITAILASLVIGLFDTTIQSLVALAILMPIVASMGGNAGTQALTVTVRQLALGDIDNKNAKRIIFKEVIIAVVNGLMFAIIMAIISYFWFNNPMLGVVIAISMVVNLFCAGFFGTLIPLGLKALKIDPAVGSTVLLTTVTDVVGFFSFLGLATWILL